MLVFLVIVAIAFFLLSYLTPYQKEDLAYMANYYEIAGNRNTELNISAFCEYFKYHFHEENGRLSDKLIPLTIGLMPKWLFSCLTSLMTISMFWFSCLIIRKRNRNVGFNCAVTVISALVLILPWHEWMFVGSYSLNYLWGAGMSLPCVYYYVYQNEIHTHKWIVRLIIPLTFISASMHEIFGVTMTCGFIIWLLLNKNKICKQRIFQILASALGMLLPLSSPAFWNRVDATYADIVSKKILLFEPFTFYIFIVLLLIFTFKNKKRKDFFYHLILPFTITLINWIIFLKVGTFNGGRSFFVGHIYSIIGILQILFHAKFINRIKLETSITSIILSVFIIICICIALSANYKYSKEMKRVTNLFVSTNSSTVFYNTITENDISFELSICRNMICTINYTGSWYYGLSQYYNLPEDLQILPSNRPDNKLIK